MTSIPLYGQKCPQQSKNTQGKKIQEAEILWKSWGTAVMKKVVDEGDYKERCFPKLDEMRIKV